MGFEKSQSQAQRNRDPWCIQCPDPRIPGFFSCPKKRGACEKKQGFSSLPSPRNPWKRTENAPKKARKITKQTKKTRKTKKAKIVLPALLQKLVGDFFFDFSQGNLENLVGNLQGISGDFFWPTEQRLKHFGENSGAFFVRKFVARKKSFVQNPLCGRATLKNWRVRVLYDRAL